MMPARTKHAVPHFMAWTRRQIRNLFTTRRSGAGVSSKTWSERIGGLDRLRIIAPTKFQELPGHTRSPAVASERSVVRLSNSPKAYIVTVGCKCTQFDRVSSSSSLRTFGVWRCVPRYCSMAGTRNAPRSHTRAE
jgi:hypothetical protein